MDSLLLYELLLTLWDRSLHKCIRGRCCSWLNETKSLSPEFLSHTEKARLGCTTSTTPLQTNFMHQVMMLHSGVYYHQVWPEMSGFARYIQHTQKIASFRCNAHTEHTRKMRVILSSIHWKPILTSEHLPLYTCQPIQTNYDTFSTLGKHVQQG